jgi:hypothetical protein
MSPLSLRVASRFKKATEPSRGALAFLTKSAKGIKGSIFISALKEALPLIGWSIEDVIVALPVDGYKASGRFRHILTKYGVHKFSGFTSGGISEEKLLYLDANEEEQAKGLFADSAEGPPTLSRRGVADRYPTSLDYLVYERMGWCSGLGNDDPQRRSNLHA